MLSEGGANHLDQRSSHLSVSDIRNVKCLFFLLTWIKNSASGTNKSSLHRYTAKKKNSNTKTNNISTSRLNLCEGNHGDPGASQRLAVSPSLYFILSQVISVSNAHSES